MAELDDSRIPVAVLGATGLVGQRMVARLADHPWFEVREVLASERSAGRRYAEASAWLAPGEVPAAAGSLEVVPVGGEVSAELCLSALESTVARGVEERLAGAGKRVVSNASAWRMDPRVPLIVPEVNAAHLGLLAAQRDWGGGIVTNPNCSTIGLVLALAPLEREFGVERVRVVSLQALSGAGTPSARTAELLGNVVPFIRGEEEKLETETRKIFGELHEGEGESWIEPSGMDVGAMCNRVPVIDGHTLCVTVELEAEVELEEVLQAWRGFEGPPQELELPSAPELVIQVWEEEDAPQVRKHCGLADGMGVHVGRARLRSARELQFVTLSHNVERGAAGGAVLVAELGVAMRWGERLG